MSRIANWNKNYNIETVGRLQMMYKDRLREQMAIAFRHAEMLENAVKKIMGESGLPTWHNIPYLNFARQVYKLLGRHSGLALKIEVGILIRLYRQKQLKYRLLIKIRNAMYDLFGPIK